MDCRTPGFPVLHYLSEFAQTYVQWVSDTIQTSHSLSPSSLSPLILSQSGSFPVSQLFVSGDQRIGASASASVLPINIQGWFLLGLAGFISLQYKGQESSPTSNSKASVLWHSAFLMVQLSHSYMTTGKTIVLTIWTFVSKVMSIFFNMLSSFSL